MKIRTSFLLFLLFTGNCFLPLFAQNPAIDVKKYTFSIDLNDQNDTIYGKADIDYEFLKTSDAVRFDLVKTDASGKGMKVDSILSEGKKLQFQQKAETVLITPAPDSSEVIIYYHGIPKDGLIISRNKYGERTFFGDNWPNRAHNWLPVTDHPSDKAYADFIVTAPSHYQVIANGSLQEMTNFGDDKTLYHYSSSVPLPTKVMVIGAAEFAVQYLEEVKNIPVSSWVYPQNREAGFHDYAVARKILEYFIGHIGPYPYAKLANVQSTTRYGGMENASNIFYSERSVTGKGDAEFLLAHEIAHQWFGDSASETDWSQLWLSEGFATYFTDLYAEATYGKEKLDEKLREERQKVINFSKTTHTPVIDTSRTDYMKLLNANSYQKGAWFLHMLRRKVGDENFWQTIRKYYKEYELSNATTEDLQKVFENVSGQKLQDFFDQWLRQYGQPVLKTNWKYTHGNLEFEVLQQQKNDFEFPLEVKFEFADGSSATRTFQVQQKKQKFSFSIDQKPVKVKLDPEVNLLFEKARS